MTPQEIEKEANELIPAYIPGTHPKFYNREEAVTIFISGANLVMERVRVLEEALKRISAMPHDGHEESWAGICNCPVGIARAALGNKNE